MKTRQWEGEVERGGYGLRIGGDDLNLKELLEPGSHVRVTIVWPDQDADGKALYRIMAPTVGTLPPRPSARSEDCACGHEQIDHGEEGCDRCDCKETARTLEDRGIRNGDTVVFTRTESGTA